METIRFIVCAYCDRTRRVNADGTVRKHKSPVSSGACTGSGTSLEGHHVSPFGTVWAQRKRPLCTGSGSVASEHRESTINMSNLPGSIVP